MAALIPTSPLGIIVTATVLGFIVVSLIALFVPWVVFFVNAVRINPFRWVDSYFDWCIKTQEKWTGKSWVKP